MLISLTVVSVLLVVCFWWGKNQELAKDRTVYNEFKHDLAVRSLQNLVSKLEITNRTECPLCKGTTHADSGDDYIWHNEGCQLFESVLALHRLVLKSKNWRPSLYLTPPRFYCPSCNDTNEEITQEKEGA